MFVTTPSNLPAGRPHVANEVTRLSSSVQRNVRLRVIDYVRRVVPVAASRLSRGAWRVACLSAAVLLFGTASGLRAHEVPPRVKVTAFILSDGGVYRVLVRAPLEAMRDVEFPLRGAGLLDLSRADSTLRDAARLWIADATKLYVDGNALPAPKVAAVRASLPSDRAFENVVDALASFRAPVLDVRTEIPAQQVMLDVMLEYPQATADARLAIEARYAHLGVRTTTVLRRVYPDGSERTYLYEGDEGLLQLEPSWWHAASRFVTMGAGHLLEGIDHLLFLLCLIVPVRRVRPLVGIVTAFTVAHSITLAASAMGYAPTALWFPPLVELLIAASIVYMAIENIVGAKIERRWLVAFGFGLVHGFGFSYALGESLQFAGSNLIVALAAFNVGIELAQLLVLVITVPVLSWLLSRVVAERTGAIIVSVLVAHTAWHWMTERFETLRSYRFEWPAMDLSLAIGGIRFVMGLLIVGGIAWALSGVMTRLATPRARGSALAMWLSAGLGLTVLGLLAPTALKAQGAVRTRSTMSGVYTAEQAAKGKEVFAGACSGCHTVASHSGELFAAKWMGRSLADFYDYVSNLMPKSAPATLTEDEYVWVTAYVLKLNGMPASSRELTAEPSLLKAIRIDNNQGGAGSRPNPQSGMQGARIR